MYLLRIGRDSKESADQSQEDAKQNMAANASSDLSAEDENRFRFPSPLEPAAH